MSFEDIARVWIEEAFWKALRVVVVTEECYVIECVQPADGGSGNAAQRGASDTQRIDSLEDWLAMSRPLEQLADELCESRYDQCLFIVAASEDTSPELLAEVEAILRDSGRSYWVHGERFPTPWTAAPADAGD